MSNQVTLDRFINAQEKKYTEAYNEIKAGKKESHWMWYVFPQLSGLGNSELSKFYAIRDLDEAMDYLNHPLLGSRLIKISTVLLELKGKTAQEIFGSTDEMKLRSCMTLFSLVKNAPPVFHSVIDRYFEGQMDEKTLNLINH